MVRVSRAHLDEMIQHAREGAPNEICGLVAGVNGETTRVYRARNAEPSPVRYLMEPRDQLRIMLEIESQGWELLGIYHSHPHTQAYPSPTDVAMAYYPDALYFIVSLADAEQPVVRAFRIEKAEIDSRTGQIREEPIEVT